MTDATVDVRVLSPSPEADGGITFSTLSTSTTIGELKTRIRDALPSKPAPDRMRIIYLGRVVTNDVTLALVFGPNDIQQGRVYNLHMVLSEAPTARSSTAPPTNPFRAMPSSNNPPSNAPNARAAAFHRPQSQPPHVDRAPAPGAPPFALPNVQAGVPVTGAAFMEQMNLAHQAAMRQMQQMQMNLNPRRAPEGTQPANSNNGQAPSGHSRSASQPTHTNTPPPRVTITQGGIGPNGERWSFSVNNGTAMLPQQQPAVGLPQLPMGFDARPPIRLAESVIGMDAQRMLDQVQSNLEAAQQQVSVINNILAPPNVAREEVWRMPPAQFQRAAIEIERLNIYLNTMDQLLHSLVVNPSYARNRELVSLQMDNESMRSATRRLIRTLSDHITARRRESQGTTREALGQPFAPPTSATTQTRQPGTESANNTFILCSPNGPHAILYSPHGTFTTLASAPYGYRFTDNMAYQRALGDVARLMAPTRANLTERPQSATPEPNAAIPGVQANVFPGPGEAMQQNNAPNPNPVQNPLLAGMQPQLQQQILQQQQAANQLPIAAIATHFWLLIRIFGMLWFFSGAGWQRTLMLSLCGLAIYVFQAGILGGHVLGNRWDRVRHYFENLVGIPHQQPAQRQRAAQQPGAANEANDNRAVDIGPGRRTRRGQPSPEEVAQRLLRERDQQQRNWLRERVRVVERSVALFVASLWPGLGERMVAAREEAEAQARRDAQDREEQERREAEEVEAEAAAEVAEEDEKHVQALPRERVTADNAAEKQERSGTDAPAAVAEPAGQAAVDKGKGRAVDSSEEASSSSVAAPAAADEGGADAAASSRQRDAWSFDDLD